VLGGFLTNPDPNGRPGIHDHDVLILKVILHVVLNLLENVKATGNREEEQSRVESNWNVHISLACVLSLSTKGSPEVFRFGLLFDD